MLIVWTLACLLLLIVSFWRILPWPCSSYQMIDIVMMLAHYMVGMLDIQKWIHFCLILWQLLLARVNPPGDLFFWTLLWMMQLILLIFGLRSYLFWSKDSQAPPSPNQRKHLKHVASQEWPRGVLKALIPYHRSKQCEMNHESQRHPRLSKKIPQLHQVENN
jgi:hypothetical protein